MFLTYILYLDIFIYMYVYEYVCICVFERVVLFWDLFLHINSKRFLCDMYFDSLLDFLTPVTLLSDPRRGVCVWTASCVCLPELSSCRVPRSSPSLDDGSNNDLVLQISVDLSCPISSTGSN